MVVRLSGCRKSDVAMKRRAGSTRPVFHTFFTGVLVSDGKVTGIIVLIPVSCILTCSRWAQKTPLFALHYRSHGNYHNDYNGITIVHGIAGFINTEGCGMFKEANNSNHCYGWTPKIPDLQPLLSVPVLECSYYLTRRYRLDFFCYPRHALDLDWKNEVRCYRCSCDNFTGCWSCHLVPRYISRLLLPGYIADELVSR